MFPVWSCLQSDVHRGLGIMAGLEAVDGCAIGRWDLRMHAAVALEELKKKDFAYVHVELPDEVVYGSDVAAKVKGDRGGRSRIGRAAPRRTGQAGSVPSHCGFCDPGSVHHGQAGRSAVVLRLS